MSAARTIVGLVACVVVAAALLTGCIDPYYSLSATAPCAGVTAAQVRAALASDETATIRDFEPNPPNLIDSRPGERVLDLWFVRDGEVVHVTMREEPSVVQATSGDAAPPTPTEHARWAASVDYATARISAANPTVRPWVLTDETQPGTWRTWCCLGTVLTLMLAILGRAWLRSRRRRAA